MITFGKLGLGWPALAKKLDNQGVLAGIELKSGRVSLTTSADLPLLRALVQGHGRKSKFVPIVSGLALFVVIGATSFLTLVGNVKQGKIVKPDTVVNPCDYSMLRKWLTGTAENNHVQLKQSSILGGISSGVIECEGTRYSYTLGSEEPKRVLKLQELDS